MASNDPAIPCGQIAKYIFNDGLDIQHDDGTSLNYNSDVDISWTFDEKKFKNQDDSDWKDKQWLDIESP